MCIFSCNLQPAHLPEGLGSAGCYCNNKKMTMEKKIVLPLLPGVTNHAHTCRWQIMHTHRLMINHAHARQWQIVDTHRWQNMHARWWKRIDYRQITVIREQEWQIMHTHTHTHVEGRGEADHSDMGEGVTNRARTHTHKGGGKGRDITVTRAKEWQIIHTHTCQGNVRLQTDHSGMRKSDKSYTHTRVKGMWDYRQITVVWEKEWQIIHTHTCQGNVRLQTDHSNT